MALDPFSLSPPLPLPLLFLAALAALLCGVLAIVRIVAFSAPPGTADEWRAEASAVAGEIRTAAEAGATDADPGVGRRLVPLASRLRGHLRAAPASVDAGLEGALYELSRDCRAIGVECAARRGPMSLDAVDDLEALAADAAALERRLSAPEPTDRGGAGDPPR